MTPSQIVTKGGDICTCGTRGTDAEQNTEREARKGRMKEGREREGGKGERGTTRVVCRAQFSVLNRWSESQGGGSRALLFQQVTRPTPAGK